MEDIKNLFGQLDLTILGQLCRQHPQLIKKVNFRDGEHQLLNIDLFAKQQADQYGNVAVIKASCKKDERKDNLNYYIANLKVSNYQDNGNQQQPSNQNGGSQQPASDGADQLPF